MKDTVSSHTETRNTGRLATAVAEALGVETLPISDPVKSPSIPCSRAIPMTPSASPRRSEASYGRSIRTRSAESSVSVPPPC